MADLIELDLVVREKGLKQSLSTVERLERQLTRAAKAIDQNRISQDRYNKILLQSKRDYQALGLSSQKATALVRKFAEAQRGAVQTTNNLTGAVKKQTQAQMAATKSSNRMGVVTQQAGYQVSDFIVQVQSGTNPFVAFSQQASQLAGVLPLVATQLGLTATAAITLSAALGIAIPIVGAIGAALFVMGGRSNKAAEEVDKLDNKIKSIKSSLEEYADAQRALAAGVTLDEYFLGLGLDQANRELKEARDNLERLEAATNSLAGASGQLQFVQQVKGLFGISEADKYEQALQRVTRAEENLAALEEQQAKQRQADYEAQANAIADTITLMQIERDFGEDSVKYLEAQVTQRMLNYNQQVRSSDLSETQKDILIDLNTQMEELNLELGTAVIESERLANNLETAASFRTGGVGGEFANVPTGLEAFGGGGDYRYDLPQTIRNTTKETKKLSKGLSEAEREAEKLRKELEQPMVNAIDGVSNAFGDFISRGLSDFKGFVNQILGSFQNMISQMIATAARNKIMLSLGFGGTGLAGQAAAGQLAGIGGASAAGPIGSFIGTFGGAGAAGTGLLGGLGTGISAFSGGIGAGLGASASAAGSLLTGGASVAAGGMGVAATIGAAIPVVGAIALAIGFFSKKVKELDSGLQGTITTLDATLESFSVIQTKRFFGLSKKVRTEAEALDAEAAQPLVDAITSMQQGIMDAADVFGIASSAFDNFAYDFELSLKGLTEEEKMQKINEELATMGDEFASLTGHFETMNELLEAANQRMQIQNRLDQLLGNSAAILARQREAELAATHELNRGLLQTVYALEDAQAAAAQAQQDFNVADQVVQQGFASLRTAIDAQKNRIRDSFENLMDVLEKRLDAANETLSRSQNIYSMLESAMSGRSISSGIERTFSRREGAVGFISGGDFSDEKRLEEALGVVAEPSEDLFGSFVDYARDFANTTRVIQEAKEVARYQLDADEKTVLLIEEQMVREEEHMKSQLEALEQQYESMERQYNALLGVDDSVKSVGTAINSLAASMKAAAEAQARAAAQAAAASAAAAQAQAAAAASAAGGGGGASAGGGGASAGLQMTGEKHQGFDLARIRGADALLSAAAANNVQTSGRSGAQIQQALSNATGLAINMDNATRALGFAMGGYHTGGLRMVGERGPELEATGPSRIFSHNQTASMFKDPDLKVAVNELRREVSGLRSEQRQMQATNAKYVKRNYDINRKWDVDGLPATRT